MKNSLIDKMPDQGHLADLPVQEDLKSQNDLCGSMDMCGSMGSYVSTNIRGPQGNYTHF